MSFAEWVMSQPLWIREIIYDDRLLGKLCLDAYRCGRDNKETTTPTRVADVPEICYVCSNTNCDSPNGKH